MKSAVTSAGTGLESAVVPRFGRCACFALVDGESGALEAVPNPFQDGAGGAGTQAAQWVVWQGVGVVLTGHCGPNATAVLDDGGVRGVEGVSGTVREAIERHASAGQTTPAALTEPAVPAGPCGSGAGAGQGFGPGPALGVGMGRGPGRGPGGGRGPGRGRRLSWGAGYPW
jgi:predicted Fe-Mo cluster-binding NifX family protein